MEIPHKLKIAVLSAGIGALLLPISTSHVIASQLPVNKDSGPDLSPKEANDILVQYAQSSVTPPESTKAVENSSKDTYLEVKNTASQTKQKVQNPPKRLPQLPSFSTNKENQSVVLDDGTVIDFQNNQQGISTSAIDLDGVSDSSFTKNNPSQSIKPSRLGLQNKTKEFAKQIQTQRNSDSNGTITYTQSGEQKKYDISIVPNPHFKGQNQYRIQKEQFNTSPQVTDIISTSTARQVNSLSAINFSVQAGIVSEQDRFDGNYKPILKNVGTKFTKNPDGTYKLNKQPIKVYRPVFTKEQYDAALSSDFYSAAQNSLSVSGIQSQTEGTPSFDRAKTDITYRQRYTLENSTSLQGINPDGTFSMSVSARRMILNGPEVQNPLDTDPSKNNVNQSLAEGLLNTAALLPHPSKYQVNTDPKVKPGTVNYSLQNGKKPKFNTRGVQNLAKFTLKGLKDTNSHFQQQNVTVNPYSGSSAGGSFTIGSEFLAKRKVSFDSIQYDPDRFVVTNIRQRSNSTVVNPQVNLCRFESNNGVVLQNECGRFDGTQVDFNFLISRLQGIQNIDISKVDSTRYTAMPALRFDGMYIATNKKGIPVFFAKGGIKGVYNPEEGKIGAGVNASITAQNSRVGFNGIINYSTIPNYTDPNRVQVKAHWNIVQSQQKTTRGIRKRNVLTVNTQTTQYLENGDQSVYLTNSIGAGVIARISPAIVLYGGYDTAKGVNYGLSLKPLKNVSVGVEYRKDIYDASTFTASLTALINGLKVGVSYQNIQTPSIFTASGDIWKVTISD